MAQFEIHDQMGMMDLIQEIGFLPLLDSGSRGFSTSSVKTGTILWHDNSNITKSESTFRNAFNKPKFRQKLVNSMTVLPSMLWRHRRQYTEGVFDWQCYGNRYIGLCHYTTFLTLRTHVLPRFAHLVPRCDNGWQESSWPLLADLLPTCIYRQVPCIYI